MKKRFIMALVSILLVALLLPATALAEGPTDIDLTTGDHSGKTLAADGYTWDEATHTLTMENLKLAGTINLPKADCTVIVKGTCEVWTIAREAGAAQSLTIKGENGSILDAEDIAVQGDLTLENVTIPHGRLHNSFVGGLTVLKLINSKVDLVTLSWMTDGGIELVNSKLTVGANGDAYFWAEKIAMDAQSEIVSHGPLMNYAHFTAEDMAAIKGYIVVPANGRFEKVGEWLTIVNEQGEVGPFTLRGSTGSEVTVRVPETKPVTPPQTGAAENGAALVLAAVGVLFAGLVFAAKRK